MQRELSAKLTEGLTTPPSRRSAAHLPLHRGGFGAVQQRKHSLTKHEPLRWSVARRQLDGGDTYANESPQALHIRTQVLIRYLRSFSFCQKWLGTRIFSTFADKINFIVSKLNTQKSKRSDLNLPVFHPFKSQ